MKRREMNVEIISIGTEYLLGTIEEPNAVFLARRITELGLNVTGRYIVGDEPLRVKSALDCAYDHADVVVMTGAAGLFKNPEVRRIAADFFGKKSRVNAKVREYAVQFGKKNNRAYSEQQLQELADVPEGALVFQSEFGPTPGYVLEKNGKALVSLPGVREEMEDIFESDVVGYLMKVAATGKAKLTLALIPEAAKAVRIEEMKKKLGEWTGYDNPEVRFTDKKGTVCIEISAIGPTKGDAKILTRIAGTNISQRIGEGMIAEMIEE